MANVKVSELAAADALTGAELVETVQSGVNVQTTTEDVAKTLPGFTVYESGAIDIFTPDVTGVDNSQTLAIYAGEAEDGYGGSVAITGGPSATGAGGSCDLSGGASDSGGGGSLTINGGDTTSGGGGPINITGGSCTTTDPGGLVAIVGGPGAGGGGAASVRGGNGSGQGSGGNLTLAGGAGAGAGAGGNLILAAGDGAVLGSILVFAPTTDPAVSDAAWNDDGHLALSGAAPNGFSAQGAPTAKTADATLTIAELLTKLITVTSATAVALTLPTGTDTDAGIIGGGLANDRAFEWVILNLGSVSGVVTLVAGTDHTIVGPATLAILMAARFRTRKIAANTFVTYRIG